MGALPGPRGGHRRVCVAGASPDIGRLALNIREAGVPVMVATSVPSLVHDLAQACGFPIPVGDIVAPLTKAPDAKGQVPQQIADDTLREAPFRFCIRGRRQPLRAHGQVGNNCLQRQETGLCLRFSFVRRPLATEAVTSTSIQNAGIGAFMFIPGADMPILTLNQVKMVLQIAAAYGQPMTANRLKEIAFVVAGAFACRSLARQGAGLVPGLGWAVKGAIGFAGTEAMGRAVIEYFDGGGNISGLANLAKKTGEAAPGRGRGGWVSAGKDHN